ncbi:MAG: protein kinase, partial [Deltaproteobacteria bacterium]|nr:protein kinase [Deltaproteobacteria bacterium]
WPDNYNEESNALFRKRIETLVGLSNQFVTKIHDIAFDKINGRDIVISEHFNGEPIFQASRGLTLVQKIYLLVQVLRGLSFIHRNGLLHLNLKSDNVYVDLVKLQAKIISWGIAIRMDEANLLKTKPVGTPFAMPHEIAFGRTKIIDTRADLFSWAVLAYWIIGDKQPFPERFLVRGNMEELKRIMNEEKSPLPLKGASPRLNDIILGMLNREPKLRPFKRADGIKAVLLREFPEVIKLQDDVIKMKLRS